jgi:hypothetical protein
MAISSAMIVGRCSQVIEGFRLCMKSSVHFISFTKEVLQATNSTIAISNLVTFASHQITAKLIDCGLAKFVEDNTASQKQSSIGRTLLKSSGMHVVGSLGTFVRIIARGRIPI